MGDLYNALGSIDGTWFLLVLAFIVIDVATGFANAVVNGALQSSKMKEGFWHKMANLTALVVAALVDVSSVRMNMGFDAPIFELSCGYVMIMELISIAENLRSINPELGNIPFMRVLDGDGPSGKHAKED